MMKLRALTLLLTAALCLTASRAEAFCGFFVGQADSSLFNSASKVVIVHDEGKTVLTMVNDYRGEPRSFALVVPVPVVLEKDFIRVADPLAVDRVDQFSSPRLVEYFDPDPCEIPRPSSRSREMSADSEGGGGGGEPSKKDRAAVLGVTIEATYTVGEYDIEILSAKQSDGLEIYLRENRYNIPKNASAALAPYIRTGMKFFVAKVNLKEQAKSGFQSLRPLQFAFPDKRFMLPIRLGMLNADGPQDLIAFIITKQFRAEPTNYRNPKLPTDMDVPTYVKDDFQRFYRDLFGRAAKRENNKAVFLEHAWNMSWCDPCAGDPLTTKELEALGVWWLRDGGNQSFITRLHARYTNATFPEDLMLKVTRDANNYQARYILRHAWSGTKWCKQMDQYRKRVDDRRAQEIKVLANLTGWDPSEIRSKMKPLPVLEDGPNSGEDPAWKNRMKDMFKQPGN